MCDRNNLSLTKSDMYYLNVNGEFFNESFLLVVIFVCSLVIGGLNIFGSFSLTSFSLLLFNICNSFLGLKKQIDNRRKVMSKVGALVQQQCPKRFLGATKIKVVRGSVVKNVRSVIVSGNSKLFGRGNKSLDVGTVSTQYLIKGDKDVLGAIEETVTNSIDYVPKKNGSKEEKVVSKYSYKWVPRSQVILYDEPNHPKSRMKK